MSDDHRYGKGSTAHVTADRSEGGGRRKRGTKPIAEGGTRPHLGPCTSCGGTVIFHRRVGGVLILLDPAELKHSDEGARFIIMFGFVISDPSPAAVPVDVHYHREHRCP